MSKTINEIMDDLKSLKEYEVQVEVPANFKMSGSVPFDMTIVSNQAFVKMIAPSIEEATRRAEEFFKQ